MLNIAIYCVTYNSYKELESYIASIKSSAQYVKETARITVYIADNTEKDVQDINYNLDCVNVFTKQFKKNLGYFGAIQKMMELYPCKDFDYTIISNVDLRLKDDTFKELVNFKLENNIGWIAPQIYSNLENRDRNPKINKRYSKRKLEVLKIMYKIPILHYIYVIGLYKRKKFTNNKNIREIYSGHGSFIILTKVFFKNINNISYPVFLFGEEIYLAELCMRNKLKVIYEPRIQVEDSEHTSTGKMKKNFYYKCNYQALDYLINKFY